MEGKILTLEDLKILFRPLTQAEELKADRLIDTVYEILQQEAKRVGKDLQTMIDQGDLSLRVLQSVIADIVGRTLMTATTRSRFRSLLNRLLVILFLVLIWFRWWDLRKEVGVGKTRTQATKSRSDGRLWP